MNTQEKVEDEINWEDSTNWASDWGSMTTQNVNNQVSEMNMQMSEVDLNEPKVVSTAQSSGVFTTFVTEAKTLLGSTLPFFNLSPQPQSAMYTDQLGTGKSLQYFFDKDFENFQEILPNVSLNRDVIVSEED